MNQYYSDIKEQIMIATVFLGFFSLNFYYPFLTSFWKNTNESKLSDLKKEKRILEEKLNKFKLEKKFRQL